VKPGAFANASFSQKQWDVLDGLKINGAGEGFFEYSIPLDKNLKVNGIKEAYFLIELSAKELFVKDQVASQERTDINYMLGAKASPSGNPNSYPMTDETVFPSKIEVTVNGEKSLATTLPDDPADHRGVLSWHHQLTDKKLREAGSYGFLTKIPVSKKQLKSAVESGKLVVRIQTVGTGGIAVYGKSFGRYPLDPSLVMKTR
jgi:predicted transcriptional regulator